jgi:hypothetical protein
MNFVILILMIWSAKAEEEQAGDNRDSRLLPVFQVVRFPNDPCVIGTSSKNGTCYTAEECSNKGGTNGGSCASGFGVCCTFTIGCGGSTSENCTYFEYSGSNSGACNARVCKLSSAICQIRLDLDTFVITGPSTAVTTNALMVELGGMIRGGNGGKIITQRTNCATDTFSVGNAPSIPVVCGTLTGDHVYFDASDSCHNLMLNFGQWSNDNTIPTTRTVSIKISQVNCASAHRAPPGCTQYFTNAAGGAKSFSTFNYANSIHLANQKQVICFRREQGNCQICYSAAAATDFHLSGSGKGNMIKDHSCCDYGTTGKGVLGGGDCAVFPGAEKKTGTAIKAVCQAGGQKGLVTSTKGKTLTATAATVCSRTAPFRVEFISDGIEVVAITTTIADIGSKGLKLLYWQNSC